MLIIILMSSFVSYVNDLMSRLGIDDCFILFLSHLLIAGCDIGVQISVRPSVRPFVRPSVRQHLRRSLVFSTSVRARSVKPYIVIVLDIPFKHAP